MQFISQFAFDPAKIQSSLEDYEKKAPRFVRGLADFCTTFKVKIMARSVGGYVLCTERGIPVGKMDFERDYSRSNTNPDGYAFLYTSPIISKQKASSRAGRSTRDSSTVTGIINALKKNSEVPNEDKLLQNYKGSMRFAYTALGNTASNKNTISLDSAATLALVKLLIENDKAGAESYRKDVESAYAQYLDRMAKINEAKASMGRFDHSTAIGVISYESETFYIVGEATNTAGNIALTNWTRYNSLYNSPVAADAAMIRAYMEGHHPDVNNELKMPFDDKFYPDIDIVTGYSSVHYGVWALIPKNAPALA